MPQQVGLGGLQDLNPQVNAGNNPDVGFGDQEQQILPDQGGRIRMPFMPGGPGLFPPQGGGPKQNPFQGFQEQLTGFSETLGGLGEQFTGFGETMGGYDKQMTDFGSQMGGMEKHFGGLNDRLSKIEEGIAKLIPGEQANATPTGQQQMQQPMNSYAMNPYMGLMSLFGGMGRSGGYF
jgi:hypothetical protein